MSSHSSSVILPWPMIDSRSLFTSLSLKPEMLPSPLLLRPSPVLCLRLSHHRPFPGVSTPLLRPCCSTTAAASSEENSSSSDKGTSFLTVKEPPKNPRWDDPDYRKWKDKEDEILKDIRPIHTLAKLILHSDKYLDGEHLKVEDENVVLERLLKYHPHAEDKIGCGVDCIVVDRHPQFRHSRCLFVVRTDGIWIDFSYQKCLRAYIRCKYPLYADKFIRDHFKRGSGL